MNDILAQYWPLILVALLIGVAVAWLVLGANRKTKVERSESGDVLDEGSAPAKRNQALIDAPPAAAAAPPPPPAPPAEPDPVPAPVAAPAPEAPMPDAQPQSRPETVRDAGGMSQPVRAAVAARRREEGANAAAADDLTKIKGVGPKLSALLHSLGVTSFSQIAGWNDADIERVDAQLGQFQGRIRRDNWMEQARFLAAGDTAAYEDRFGKL